MSSGKAGKGAVQGAGTTGTMVTQQLGPTAIIAGREHTCAGTQAVAFGRPRGVGQRLRTCRGGLPGQR